jgi:SAM-dependent methyltransferase
MELSAYEVESAIEQDHWWFKGRRRLLAAIIRELGIALDRPVLDVGTSTGTNLRMLREIGFAQPKGLDASPEAIQFCQSKGLGPVELGNICNMPFAENSFDLVLATDVIEHVEDDSAAVKEIHRVLVPGGVTIITVPAFQFLWGTQDRLAHHLRRYRAEQVLRIVRGTQLRVQRAFYFNYLLLVPIWIARQMLKITGLQLRSENEINSPALNRLFYGIFRLDVATAPYLSPPFGVSFLVVAHKV